MKTHDPYDREEAFKRALESEPYPLGIFYMCERPIFEEKIPAYKTNKTPLWKREPKLDTINKILDSKRRL